MATSQATVDKRLSDLTQYTAELHNMLEFAIERIRELEAAVGRDSHRIERTEEWLQRMEHTFTGLLKQHNWHWPTVDDPAERRLGAMSYQQILRVGEMLPLDRCLAIWHQHAPHDAAIPRGWTDVRPVAQSLDPFEGRSDKELVKQVKDNDKRG